MFFMFYYFSDRQCGVSKIRELCGVQGEDGGVGEGVREEERGGTRQAFEEETTREGGKGEGHETEDAEEEKAQNAP